jgi:hypothetical protein
MRSPALASVIMYKDKDEIAYQMIAKGPKRGAPGRGRVCGARGDWQRPIVPQGCPCSIVGAGGLNDRVRDGNGCVPSAVVTNPPASHNSRENYAHSMIGHDGRRCLGNTGGDEGTRTPDPLDANQMLSQLSYAPRRQSDRIANEIVQCAGGPALARTGDLSLIRTAL